MLPYILDRKPDSVYCNHLSGSVVTNTLERHFSCETRPCTGVGVLPFHFCITADISPKGPSLSTSASLLASRGSLRAGVTCYLVSYVLYDCVRTFLSVRHTPYRATAHQELLHTSAYTPKSKEKITRLYSCEHTTCDQNGPSNLFFGACLNLQ